MTNHPGVVVFDEPEQQRTDPVSIEAFLQRASASLSFSQQVLVATSQREEEIRAILGDRSYQLNSFDGRILTEIG